MPADNDDDDNGVEAELLVLAPVPAAIEACAAARAEDGSTLLLDDVY